jgi:hypothetical protein
MTGKALFALLTCGFKILYKLYGVANKEVFTKNIIAVARKGSSA